MTYKTEVLQLGPAGYWRLEETSGTSAVDATTHGNDGSYVGSPTLDQPPLIQGGRSVEFGGSGDHVAVGASSSLNNSDAWTVLAWVKSNATQASDTGILTEKFNAGDGFVQYQLGVGVAGDDGDTVSVGFYDGTWRQASAPLAHGTTVFLVGVWDGTDLVLYADGAEAARSTPGASVAQANDGVVIGGPNNVDAGSPNGFFGGRIDEAAVLGKALTATQVRRLYYAGLGYQGYVLEVLSSAPAGYWRLDESSGTAAAATIGADGTYVGSPTLGVTSLVGSGLAVDFTAAAQHMEVASFGDHLGSAGAVELWLQPHYSYSDASISRMLFGAGVDGNNYLRAQLFTDGQWYIGWKHGGTDERMTLSGATLPVQADQKSHIVLTWDAGAGTIALYHNGEQVASSSITGTADLTGAKVYFGENESESNNGDAVFDEVVVYDHAQTDTEIRRRYYRGLGYDPYGVEALALKPLAYWRLDEGTGTTAADETGSHDGTYNGSPTLAGAPLIQTGQAVTFDGTDDYVDVGTLGLFGSSMDSGFAFACWLSWSHTDSQRFAGQVNVYNSGIITLLGVNYDVNLGNSPGQVLFYLRDANDNVVKVASARTDLNDGNPHFYAVTWDGAATYPALYIDGKDDTGATSGSGWTGFANYDYPLTIGAYNNRGSVQDHFAGQLDEFTLFDRELTADEVEKMYFVGLYASSVIAYMLAGTITADGSAAEATVRAYRWDNGQLVAETTSDPGDGTYAIENLAAADDLMVVTKPAAGFRPLAHGPITPTEQ
ncbi:MAG TPA: LamG domain-containing protein [Gammaproteobacteria bacterium]|nr:LamG domain-containing protein [Gammaproteobacteria bacterium]